MITLITLKISLHISITPITLRKYDYDIIIRNNSHKKAAYLAISGFEFSFLILTKKG